MSATSGIYGIGKGDAQVFSGNPALSMLQQAHQQDLARKAREDAAFQAELGKVNFDGARQADLEPLLKSYEAVKDKYSLLRSAQSPLERNRIMNSINSDKQQLLSMANLSKQTNAAEAKYAQLRLDRNNDLKDDFGRSYTGLIGTSIFDPAYKTKAEYFNDPFHPQYDTDKLAKEVEGMAIRKTEGKPYSRVQGGWQQLVRQDATKLDEDAAKAFITQKAIQDPSLRRSIMFAYGKNGETPEQATDAFVQNMLPALRAKNTTVEKVLGSQAPERPDKFYEHQAYLQTQKLNNAALEDDGRDEFVTALQQKDTNARGDLIRAVNRAGGRFSPSKNGFTVIIPTPQKITQKDSNGKIITTTEMQDKVYTITNDASEKSKELINTMLNQVDLFKPRPLYEKKSNPYGKKPTTKPASSSSTTTKVTSTTSGKKKNDPLGLF